MKEFYRELLQQNKYLAGIFNSLYNSEDDICSFLIIHANQKAIDMVSQNILNNNSYRFLNYDFTPEIDILMMLLSHSDINIKGYFSNHIADNIIKKLHDYCLISTQKILDFLFEDNLQYKIEYLQDLQLLNSPTYIFLKKSHEMQIDFSIFRVCFYHFHQSTTQAIDFIDKNIDLLQTLSHIQHFSDIKQAAKEKILLSKEKARSYNSLPEDITNIISFLSSGYHPQTHLKRLISLKSNEQKDKSFS